MRLQTKAGAWGEAKKLSKYKDAYGKIPGNSGIYVRFRLAVDALILSQGDALIKELQGQDWTVRKNITLANVPVRDQPFPPPCSFWRRLRAGVNRGAPPFFTDFPLAFVGGSKGWNLADGRNLATFFNSLPQVPTGRRRRRRWSFLFRRRGRRRCFLPRRRRRRRRFLLGGRGVFSLSVGVPPSFHQQWRSAFSVKWLKCHLPSPASYRL